MLLCDLSIDLVNHCFFSKSIRELLPFDDMVIIQMIFFIHRYLQALDILRCNRCRRVPSWILIQGCGRCILCASILLQAVLHFSSFLISQLFHSGFKQLKNFKIQYIYNQQLHSVMKLPSLFIIILSVVPAGLQKLERPHHQHLPGQLQPEQRISCGQDNRGCHTKGYRFIFLQVSNQNSLHRAFPKDKSLIIRSYVSYIG